MTSRRDNQIFLLKRITNLAEDSANSYIKEEKFKLESVFDPIRSPYFEVLTKKIECPEEFKPLTAESTHPNNKVFYYILYANERFAFGVCSKDLIKYRAIVAFTYCKNTRDLYHLKYFIPNQEYNETAEETIKSFSC